VEELCDHIALIDKSNKILDGNLIDIKRQYKTNSFEVGLMADNLSELQKNIESKFKVSSAEFKTLEDDLKLNIQLSENESSKDLIQYLSSKATINHFVELIPSANDIFIKAVTNNELKRK
jgi:ABC-2 type transport system ATP-binding protein